MRWARATQRLLSGSAVLALAAFLAETIPVGSAVGLLNLPALLLVLVAPWGVALIAYEPREIWLFVRQLYRALGDSERQSGLARDATVGQIAKALKADRPQDAAAAVDGTDNAEAREVGLLLLKQYDRASAKEALGARAQAELAQLRRGEDFFLMMARAAPAFGLIGTILGFIDLLRHLADASALGPGMALALTATLYGIASSYCVYHPLGKGIGAYAKKRAGAWKSAEAAMLMTYDGRTARDIAGAISGAA